MLEKIIQFRNTHKFSMPTVLIGLGLLIFPLWGAWIGYPAVTAGIGYSFLLVASLYSLFYFRKDLRIGTWWILAPLLVILFFALDRFFAGSEELKFKFLLFAYVFVMVLFYFCVKQKGKSLLWFVIPGLLIYGGSAIVDSFVNIGRQAEGLSTNRDVLGSALVFYVFMLQGRWRWLAPIGIVAILLTGSYWALGSLVVAGLVLAITKWGLWVSWVTKQWPLVVCFVLVLCMVVITLPIGRIFQLDKVSSYLNSGDSLPTMLHKAGHDMYRLAPIEWAFGRVQFFGNGYYNNETLYTPEEADPYKIEGSMPIHNVPVMIMDELGPLAALAWLFTVGYGIVKSKKYRYVLIAILVSSTTGVYDFWYWTSLGSYYFLVMGLVANEVENHPLKSL